MKNTSRNDALLKRDWPLLSLIIAASQMTMFTENAMLVMVGALLWENPCLLVPVPLSIFRSNSKFAENSKHSSVKYSRLMTTIFCTRHDSVTVVTCAKYRCDRSKLERSEFSSNFEFDRNMLSGTGAQLVHCGGVCVIKLDCHGMDHHVWLAEHWDTWWQYFILGRWSDIYMCLERENAMLL